MGLGGGGGTEELTTFDMSMYTAFVRGQLRTNFNMEDAQKRAMV